MVRIATYNVENLVARHEGFRTADPDVAKHILAAYEQVNQLFKKGAYSADDKAEISREATRSSGLTLQPELFMGHATNPAMKRLGGT